MNKTLMQMAAEVKAVNDEKGWNNNKSPAFTLIALLHSEVSEALEAYRYWGLADATESAHFPDGTPIYDGSPAKPEGVGSEFADVLIRWLDMGWTQDYDLDAIVAKYGGGQYGMLENFGDAICVFHMHISRLAYAVEDDMPTEYNTVERYYVAVFRYLAQLADFLGIDLDAEYERKIAYNRRRPYRHGGKKL